MAWIRTFAALITLLSPTALAALNDYTDGPTYPGSWPSVWKPYTVDNQVLYDRTSKNDPTTGGTTPNGTVDLVGVGAPAALYHADGENLYMRFRLDGPPMALNGSSQPYVSATWNVLIDADADGFKEFAVMLEGMNVSSQPDDLRVMYNDDPVQTVDRMRDVIWVQDAARDPDNPNDTSDGESGGSEAWDLDDDAYVWDFTRTRVTQLDTSVAPGSNKSAYHLDIQVPIEALDATHLGGKKLEPSSIVRFAITTANSNTDPAQKDFAYFEGYPYGGPSDPLPPGDSIDLEGGGPYLRPIVTSIDVGAVCAADGGTELVAGVVGRTHYVETSGITRTRVENVEFFYTRDANQDGELSPGEDDGWISLGTVELDDEGRAQNGSVDHLLGPWRTTVDASALPTGHLLIKAVASDDVYTTDSTDRDPGSVTYNPATRAIPSPSFVYGSFLNTCGTAAGVLSKSISESELSSDQAGVEFAITISNPSGTPIELLEITDPLAAGFAFEGTLADESTLTPTTGPVDEGPASDVLRWTFTDVEIAAGSSETLVFSVTGPSATGTYANRAYAETSIGSLSSEEVEVGVGALRLGLTMVPTFAATGENAATADPGDTIVYTATYRNDSGVNAAGVEVAASLPPELTNVRAITAGGTLDGDVVTWEVGDLPSGDGPFELEFTADIVGPPYPVSGSPLLQVPATITATSPQTDAVTAYASTLVRAPRAHLNLNVRTVGDVTIVDAEEEVEFVFEYGNSGHRVAEGAMLAFDVPAGFDLVPSGSETEDDFHFDAVENRVSWDLGDIGGQTEGSRSIMLKVIGAPAPELLEAVLEADLVEPVTDDYLVGLRPAPIGEGTLCEDRQVPWHFDMASAYGDVPLQIYATRAVPSEPFYIESTLAHWDESGAEDYGQAFLVVTQDEVSSMAMEGEILTSIPLALEGGGNLNFVDVTLYKLDENDDPEWLGSTAVSGIAGSGSSGELVFNEALSVEEVEAGHRLQFVFTNTRSNTNSYADFSMGDETAHTHFSHCYSVPELVLDKHVDKLEVQPGLAYPLNSLTYTLNYSNVSQSSAPGVELVDTLPPGVGVESVSVPEGATHTVEGDTVTVSLGNLESGEEGTVQIEVIVEDDLPDAINGFWNHAILSTSVPEAAPVEDQIYTSLIRTAAPDLSIGKRVDESLLVEGGTARYRTEVYNSGLEPAEDVVITDVLDVSRAGVHPRPNFDFANGTFSAIVYDDHGTQVRTLVEGEGWSTAVDDATGERTFTIGGEGFTLASEHRLVVDYAFDVEGTVPDGLHEFSSRATVDADELDPRTSDEVIVTVSGNPNLRIAVTAEEEEVPLADRTLQYIEYEVCVSNTGMTDAVDVVASAPVPDLTSYVPGSLTTERATARTFLGRPTCTPTPDAGEAEEAVYDSDTDRIRLVLDDYLGNERVDGRIIRYRVLADEVLPELRNPIEGAASVSAINAATKRAAVTVVLEAAPDLRIIKSGPPEVPYPVAEVEISGARGARANVNVLNPSTLSPNDWVAINGEIVRIEAIEGNAVTLSRAVPMGDGDFLYPVFEYRITYSNQGTTSARGTVVSDELPPGMELVAGFPAPDRASVSGALEWDVGELPAGDGGAITLRVRPTEPGAYENTATVASGEYVTASEPVETLVGGLLVQKESGKKEVYPSRSSQEDARTTYTITIRNPLRIPAGTIHVTDVLPNGFQYVEMDGTVDAPCNLDENGAPHVIPQSEEDVSNPEAYWDVLEWTCELGEGGGESPYEEIELRFVVKALDFITARTYDNHVHVDSDTVGVVQFQSELSPLDDVTVSYDSGADIYGSVYRDENLNGQKDAGEDWGDGVTVRVNLIHEDTQRVVSIPVEVTKGQGSFSFLGRPAGSYSIVVTDSYISVDPKAPMGWAFVDPGTGVLEIPELAETDEVYEKDFGLFLGTRVEGKVFRDDGLGGGQANNVVQEGAEKPLSNVSVSLAGSNGGTSIRTGADGSYEYFVPASWGTEVALTHDAGVTTGFHDREEPHPVPGFADAEAFAAAIDNAAGGHQYRDVGVVRPSSYTSDRVGNATSPGSTEYVHFYRPGTFGEVTFRSEGTLDRLEYEYFVDENCDGTIEAGERTPRDRLVIDNEWPRAPDGRFESCIVEARVLVPHGLTPGRTDIATLTADLAWEHNPGTIDGRSLTDVTTIKERVDLLLEATVENASREDDEAGTISRAEPEEDLEYCAFYQNIGIGPLTEVRINMPVPFHTDFTRGAYDGRDVRWSRNGDDQTFVLEDEGVALTGRLVSAEVGDLMPAENGTVCFQVQVR